MPNSYELGSSQRATRNRIALMVAAWPANRLTLTTVLWGLAEDVIDCNAHWYLGFLTHKYDSLQIFILSSDKPLPRRDISYSGQHL